METRYEVEWCVSVPRDESGELILDAAEYRRADAATLKDAERIAESKLPIDVWGSVKIKPFTQKRNVRIYLEPTFIE